MPELPNDQCREFEFPVIYEYGDAEAVDDGMLVPITKRDRCARGLFEDLCRFLPSSPPNRWPVSLFDYIAGSSKNSAALLAVGACKGLIGRNGPVLLADRDASPLALWMIRADAESPITALAESEPADNSGVQIWLAANELGGITIMYPSDW